MRLRSALLLVLSSYACGGPSDRIAGEPSVPVIESQTKSALVHWSLVSSSCPQDQGLPAQFDASGTVTIEEDRIELGLTTMPNLTGQIEDGQAEISGVTTFFVEEEVTCSVEGVAELRSDGLVVAQVTEALSSASTINCVQDWSLELEY